MANDVAASLGHFTLTGAHLVFAVRTGASKFPDGASASSDQLDSILRTLLASHPSLKEITQDSHINLSSFIQKAISKTSGSVADLISTTLSLDPELHQILPYKPIILNAIENGYMNPISPGEMTMTSHGKITAKIERR